MNYCANCGNVLKEKYCGACGQQKFHTDQLKIRPFFRNAFKDFTHFDFKIFRDLKYLLFRPGFLTNEFIVGRINSHIKPVSMFLWLNVFFFLWGYKSILPTNKYHAADFYVKGLTAKTQNAAALKGMAMSEYISEFNNHLVSCQKSMFFFVIPFFAFLLFLLYCYRKNNLFVKQLVYSIHFWSYLFIWFTLVPLLFILLNSMVKLVSGNELFEAYDGTVFLWVLILGIIPYTYIASRKVHKQSVFITLLNTVAVFFLVILTRELSISATYYLAYYLTG